MPRTIKWTGDGKTLADTPRGANACTRMSNGSHRDHAVVHPSDERAGAKSVSRFRMPPAPGAGLTRQEAEQHLYVVSMARCRNTVNCSPRLSLLLPHVNAELGPSL